MSLFVLGFAAVFVAYGAIFCVFASWLVRWQDLITRILGILVILMGLTFIGAFAYLQRTLKLSIRPPTGMPERHSSESSSASVGHPAWAPRSPRCSRSACQADPLSVAPC